MLSKNIWASALLAVSLLVTSTQAAGRVVKYPLMTKDDHINKLPLMNDLEGLRVGLEKAMGKGPKRQAKKWNDAWISSDCKTLAETHNFSVSDIETYNVHYDDCDQPWILCHHKNSPDPIEHFFENFGKIPVRARSYVREAISVPDAKVPGGFNLRDFIAVFNVQNAVEHQWSSFETLLHETGHSLDHHAYIANNQDLSKSKEWADALRADAKVSDTYGASRLGENVAQMAVISAFDLNVPGQLKSVEPKWKDIQHTLDLIRKKQHDAGDLLVPGGNCTMRFQNNPPVPKDGKATRRSQVAVEADSDGELNLVEPDIFVGGGPSRRSEMPDVSLAEGLEIIPPSSIRTEYRCEH